MSELVEEVDTNQLSIKLTAYALSVFAVLRLGGRGSVISGLGKGAEDFAQQTLTDYFSGKLEYDPSRGTLFSLLRTALRHDIIDALHKDSHKFEEGRPNTTESPDPMDAGPPALDEYPANDGNNSFDTLYVQKLYCSFKMLLGAEFELLEVVGAVLFHDLIKPSEIATFLNTTAKDIQNRRKRIRRRLVELASSKHERH